MFMRKIAIAITIGFCCHFSPALNAEEQITTPHTPDFQTIAADKNFWPQNVILKVDTGFPLMLNGKQAGIVTVAAGTTVQLISVNANGELAVTKNGNQAKVLAEKTNFAEAFAESYATLQTKLAELKAAEEIKAKNEALRRAENQRQALIQEQLDTVSQRPERGHSGTPGVHVLRVKGRVLQVLPEGILVADWDSYTLDPYTDERGISHSGSSCSMPETLLIVGVESSLVDGSVFSGVVYPAGRFAYTSTTGATRTALRYAATPELALKYQSAR